MRDLGALRDNDSAAVAVNDRGQVIGGSGWSWKGRHAFLWEEREDA